MSSERLEPDDGKLSSPVLRGGNGSNTASLPDLATRRGFHPMCSPIPRIGPDVVGLGLAVEGKFVPLMVKLGRGRGERQQPAGV